jgi:hypothetical protein
MPRRYNETGYSISRILDFGLDFGLGFESKIQNPIQNKEKAHGVTAGPFIRFIVID